MPTSSELLLQAVERNGLTWGDIIQRTSIDNNLTVAAAADFVNRLKTGRACPLPVAVAIISIITDLRYATHRALSGHG